MKSGSRCALLFDGGRGGVRPAEFLCSRCFVVCEQQSQVVSTTA